MQYAGPALPVSDAATQQALTYLAATALTPLWQSMENQPAWPVFGQQQQQPHDNPQQGW